MVGLTVVALFFGHDTTVTQTQTAPHHTLAQEVEVTVEGAVEKPGSYQVQRGATLREVLSQAVPTRHADLKRLKLDKTVRQGQVIKVPEYQMIAVHLKGAVVSPQTLSLPKGSRLSDLIPLLEFEPDANVKQLQKKRRLKDGETITVRKVSGKEAKTAKKKMAFE